MKKKKPIPRPAASPLPAAAAFQMPVWVPVSLYGLLLFMAMTLQTGRMSVLLPVLALVLSIGRAPARRLRERFCVTLLAFIGFIAVYGAAAIYARFGGYAVNEFNKFAASSALAVLLLTRFDKRHARGLLWALAAVCAAVSFLCVDQSSCNEVFQVFSDFIGRLGGTFEGVKTYSTRVSGIYNDANVSASILALGSLAGMHLAVTGERPWERLAACLLLGMNIMGFFLSLSRAGIVAFGLSLLVYLFAVGKTRRMRLFILSVLTLFFTLAFSVPATRGIGLETWTADGMLLLCGLAVFGVYELLGLRAAGFLDRHSKAAVVTAVFLVVAAAVYGTAALSVEGPFTFSVTGEFDRWVVMNGGEYALSGDWDGEMSVYISFQTDRDVLLDEFTRLYWGDAREAVFTVPERGRVGFQFKGEEGNQIRRVSWSDEADLVLSLPLLPDFVTNRLQEGLFTSVSYVWRMQYFRDGWTLFKRAPLVGGGLGSTEGLLTSVQPYYYESLFVHNHIIQILDDCGLLGMVFFLPFLLGSAWLALRRAWRGDDPLAGALLACWAMINSHSLLEINFSVRAYQCVAFFLLLLPVILYGKPVKLLPEAAARWSGAAALGALCLYLGFFSLMLELHRVTVRESADFSTRDAEEFMEATKRWIEMDIFDHEQDQLNFVANAVLLEDARYSKDMEKYVRELRASGTYTACTGLAEYYYLPRGKLSEVFAVSMEAVAQEASSSDAWNQQFDFYLETVLPVNGDARLNEVVAGILALRDYLESFNEGRVEEIQLTEKNQRFITWAETVQEEGLEGEAALLLLMASV